ncbi:MAG: TolC family protein [Acidobacteria bacterium]|jgi:outer membrane protein TolC|nr:TolC family protein [Acidobacteriota bacterium]
MEISKRFNRAKNSGAKRFGRRKERNYKLRTKTDFSLGLPNYYNQQDGISINELIEGALETNQDLAASRLEIERAKARLNQVRLRPNPTLEFEQSSGAIIGSPGGGQFTVGASLPIEIYGRRDARINVAQIEIQASEAEIRNRERILVANILTNYSEALSALRELDATERLLDLDLQTARFVQIRVNEGETSPLELSLLQGEVERLRSAFGRSYGEKIQRRSGSRGGDGDFRRLDSFNRLRDCKRAGSERQPSFDWLGCRNQIAVNRHD